MKKIIRTIFVSLCSISLLLTLIAPITSSYMQAYYKGLIDAMPENAQALLDNKQIWATIGETKIFVILLLFFLFCFAVSELIIWIKNKKYQKAIALLEE